jgi:uncharacterized membrane protein YeaQ/YmgE (transglycosylase-associated protein family)
MLPCAEQIKLSTMGLIWSLIIGGISIWMADLIMKGQDYGVLVNILLGIRTA